MLCKGKNRDRIKDTSSPYIPAIWGIKKNTQQKTEVKKSKQFQVEPTRQTFGKGKKIPAGVE